MLKSGTAFATGVLLCLAGTPTRVAAQSGSLVVAAPVARSAADSARSPAPRQVAKTPARPDFKNLRFEEAWTRANRSGRWDDDIKAIPLDPKLTLTLGGQVRWREEFAHAFNFSGASSDTYGQSRVLLDADLQAGDARRVHGRVYGEFRDAQSYNRELPGGTRASDADRSDVQNLFADVGYARSYVRVGRQEVVTNRERLVGVPDWSNTRRAMQGVRTLLVRGSFAIDAFDVRPVQVKLAEANGRDTTTRLRAIGLGSAPGAKPLARGLPSSWQAYWYEQVVTAATLTRRLTSGGRALWTMGSTTKQGRSYSIETEAAVQRGATGARALRAWFWTAETQVQWRGVRGAPTLALGVEEASGDRNSADSRLEAFNTLYAAAHAHGGYADVFGRANARESHAISTWDPVKKVSLRGAWHRYDRLRLEDGVYNKQNTLLRAANGSRARHAGDEFDLTGVVNLTRHLRLIGGYALVQPGAFLRRTPGSAQQERWGFAGTTFTF